jgi:hypothetical protein
MCSLRGDWTFQVCQYRATWTGSAGASSGALRAASQVMPSRNQRSRKPVCAIRQYLIPPILSARQRRIGFGPVLMQLYCKPGFQQRVGVRVPTESASSASTGVSGSVAPPVLRPDPFPATERDSG